MMEAVKSRLFHLILIAITIIVTPLSVFLYNPRYLYSQTGYSDGGDMYSHIVEAVHLKELLQNGTTDFWFEKVSLGYPMFTAYQPLPCFFIAIVMLIFDSILSPLLVFRLIFLTVLSLVPFAFYKSSRLFGMRPIQGIIICLLTFSVQSWRKFGLEISAFIEYGLLTQAFGMLFIPLAVSSCYNWIFLADMDKKSSILPFLALAVTFLSNFFFGLYACILSAVMFSIKLASIRNTASLKSILDLVQRFARVHLSWVLLISWWILSCLHGYRYIGGLPWRSESEDGYPVSYLYDKLINGDVFDYGRLFPWLTVLVLFGFITSNLKIARLNIPFVSYTCEDRTFSCWLVLSSVVSVVLFLGRTTFSVLYDLIPFHAELETVKYLNAVHFCGILLASSALTDAIHAVSKLVCHIIESSSQTSLFMSTFEVLDNWHKMFGVLRSQTSKEHKVNESGVRTYMSYIDTIVKSLLVMFISVPLWCNQFSIIGPQLTMTEVSSSFTQSLQSLRNNSIDGRLLGHKALGTARSWDLALIPVLTGKPGLMTYSRGYHDSLSIFYLESLSFNPEKTQLFTSMLRLYNVHFLMTSWIELDAAFMKTCNMKHLMTIEDLVFYELLTEDSDYGYFDFVRIPGRLQGNLKQIRETVLKTFDFYTVNSVLKINPHRIDYSNDDVIIDVKKSNWLDRFSENSVQVTWTWKGLENDSQVIIDGFVKENSWKWVYSQVIEERMDGVSYQAIVHIAESTENTQDSEHLLLKVTYHPFWKCFYYPVRDDFALSNFKQPYFLDGKQYLTVNHVTPNLMSVSLPSGRYLVVFTYRFPRILKILAFICVVCGLWIFVDYLQKKLKSQNLSTTTSEIKRKYGVMNKSHSTVRRELIFSENGSVVNKICNSDSKMSNTESKMSNAESEMSNAESEMSNAESKSYFKSFSRDHTARTKRPLGERGEHNFGQEKSSFDVMNGVKSLKYANGDAVGGTKSWNVKGRLRSLSIAAATRFNADTMRFSSKNPENRNMGNVSKRLKTKSQDSSSMQERGNRSNLNNQREILSEKSYTDDSIDSQSFRSLITDDSVISSNQICAVTSRDIENRYKDSDESTLIFPQNNSGENRNQSYGCLDCSENDSLGALGKELSEMSNTESKSYLKSLGRDHTARTKRPLGERGEHNIGLEKSSLDVMNGVKSLKYANGDAVDGTKSWNVKGRLRSLSIAAATRFNADTMRFSSKNPENRNMGNVSKRLKTKSNDSSSMQERVNRSNLYNQREILSGKSYTDNSIDSQSSRSLITDDSVISSNQIGAVASGDIENCYKDSDDSTLIFPQNNSGENRNQSDGCLDCSENDSLGALGKELSEMSQKQAVIRGDIDANRNKNGFVDGGSNDRDQGDSKDDDNDDGSRDNGDYDDDNDNCKGENVGSNYNKESSNDNNNHDDSDDDNVLKLRDRLAKLDQSSNFEQEDNYGGMVKQLRKTYIRQRRNTLSALPTFKK